MDLTELKKQFILEELGINKDYGRIFSFIDFGNVNYWFEKDRQDYGYHLLKENEKFVIGIKELNRFTRFFSEDVRFYYGHDK